MMSVFIVSGLVAMCGFITIPELTIVEIDANTLTVFKFVTILAFMVHIMGMLAMGVLLVNDTIERIQNPSDDDM